MSTGVESERVVRRRRAFVTRRLVPLAGGPNIVFLRSTQAKIGVDSCWRRHSRRVHFVPNEYFSSFTPHLLHVCDSYFPALDQYAGDPLSSLIQATGNQLMCLCRSSREFLGGVMIDFYWLRKFNCF